MKISEINKPALQLTNNNLKKGFSLPKITEQKQVEKSAYELTGNYNIAFCGLFKRKTDPLDATTLAKSIPMVPEMEYIVDNDAQFEMGDYTLDLSSKTIKQLIDFLKPKQNIIFGRCAVNPNFEMNKTVSSQHLKITKNKQGQLVAQDLNSTNGTTIKQNIFKPNKYDALEPSKKYLIPANGVLMVGNLVILMQDMEQIYNNIEDGTPLILGRGDNADIYYNGIGISRNHLEITRYDHNYIVKDLDSTNGTKYLGETQKYKQDFSKIKEPVFLQINTTTKVPNECQLYLGYDLTIDLRNKNILEELDKKRCITIGRNENCDFVVPEFYNQVSRQHLSIEKDGDDIIVKDLGSTNGTQVIPKNSIKPFYGDLKNLHLKQGNIGDCFLLATLYGLSKTRQGREHLQRMVQVDYAGNYMVKFNNKAPIKITPEELDGQTDNQGNRKRSVSGDLGLKAIERAYGKLLKDEQYLKFLEKNSNVTLFYRIDQGGNPAETLKKLTGIKSVCHSTSDGNIKGILFNIARTGIENHILMCSTDPDTQYGKYKDPQYRFIGNHAYGIGYIDIPHQTIGIVNPHNTKSMETISWQEFETYFDYLYDAAL